MLATLVRPYLAIFAARFSMLLQYRAAALAGIATQFWFGAIMVMALVRVLRRAAAVPRRSRSPRRSPTFGWGRPFSGCCPGTSTPRSQP